MHKLAMLPLVALLCFTPLVVADFAQEIAQVGTEQAAAGLNITDGLNDATELPLLDEVPGTQPVPAAPTAAPIKPFTETRLGLAFAVTPPGAKQLERDAQFLIAFWHEVVQELHLQDYSRPKPPRFPGPAYDSRALAIVHLAMYDAYVGVTAEAKTYLTYKPADLPKNIKVDIKPIAAAVAAGLAAAEVLTQQYPDDVDAIQESRKTFVETVTSNYGPTVPFISGTEPWPMTVAKAIIANRNNDGSGDPTKIAFLPFAQVNGGSNKTFQHTPDPTEISKDGKEQLIYAPHWGLVQPFMFSKAGLPSVKKSFPKNNPLTNYAAQVKEVRDVGRRETPEARNPFRTADQTRIGIFWAYDGAFKIGVPPRLYNSIADDVLIDFLTKGDPNMATGFQLVKFYALINVALGDAGISCWKDKYAFNFWRPIIGIRRAAEDPVSASLADPKWLPLGAPKTNGDMPGFTPSFPAFTSGHATFGTAVLEMVKLALKPAASRKFVMYSDEFNGENVDTFYCAIFKDCVANKRPNLQRTLTIDAAIAENTLSRIYLGVHWRSDVESGAQLGKKLAQDIFKKFPAST